MDVAGLLSGEDGEFHIDGVTGPDEYTAIVADNTYTNLMAAREPDVRGRKPRLDAGGRSRDSRRHRRRDAVVGAGRRGDRMPFDEERDIHEQDRGFNRAGRSGTSRRPRPRTNRYPLLLHVPYFDIYRKQVIKQADLVLAMHWCGDSFSLEEKARAFAYYEAL